VSERTTIEWCDSTFNPWMGCTNVSPGCDHCYAETLMDKRYGKVQWGAGKPRVRTSPASWRKPLLWEREHEAFELMHGRRRRVFCASLADVFDNVVDPAWRAELFALIAGTPNLDWLLLTKRVGNVAKMIEAPGMQKCGLPPNVWLGATICNQEEADRDIPKLLTVPARVRFLSIEPMLGDIRLSSWLQRSPSAAFEAGRITADMPAWTRYGSTALDWVICGGESGTQARPMHPDWVRSLRDQCASAGVPFHFKQWGEWTPGENVTRLRGTVDTAFWDDGWSVYPLNLTTDHGHIDDQPDLYRVGKKAAGRLLDGIVHDGFPRADGRAG